MGSSPPNRLTPLQQDLLAAFFARERRFFLTGGGALAGFYFGHRDTEDLDFFTFPGADLEEAAAALEGAAAACGATLSPLRTFPDFRRFMARRGDEECVVDLVIDRAPPIDAEKAEFGDIRVDTLREITANKITTLVSRAELKDLVDVKTLVEAGADLHQAFEDAAKKDAGVDPATVAWLLEQVRIAPGAILPGDTDPAALDTFRQTLIRALRAEAFRSARRE